jgi:outer membrane protein
MKNNGMLIWNVLLSLVAGFLLVGHFTSKKGGSTKSGKGGNDSTANNIFKIAYFEMDSVASSFSLVKEVKDELTKKEQAITDEIDKKAKAMQQRYMYFQKQQENGSLTPQQAEAAGVELKKMEDDIKLRKQQLDQDYFELKTRKENDVKKSIEEFVRQYNKGKNFAYVMSYEPGLFYYKDTALNITGDVIKGLNAAYPPGKKAN